MASEPTTPTHIPQVYRSRGIVTRGLMYLILTLGAIVAVFPFIWMLLTASKTYGEHSQRKFWPVGLTAAPYANRPATQTIIVPLHSPTNDWHGAASSFSPHVEGSIPVQAVTPFVEELLRAKETSVPFNVLILALDSTNDEVQNYDRFILTMGSRIVEQFSTRIDLKEWGGPNYEGSARGRWGPHFEVIEAHPDHLVIKQGWNMLYMFFGNYFSAWKQANFAQYTRNSIITTTLTIAGVVITGTLAAYAFARMNFPAKGLLFTAYLATYMIPWTVVMIPNYLIIIALEDFFKQTFGIPNAWYNNWTALTIPFMVNTFTVFLLRQFFAQIPDDLFDAALIDGCGHLRFLTQIVLPMSKAPLMSVVIFNGIWAWNSLQWPLIVTSTPNWRPITVGLSGFITEAGAETQLIMAGSVITTIPILVLYFFTQKQFTEGIATTGLKG
ncbi:MAG TPA: carbohydrate ABC transporter permease [Chloroflexi bacterium]|nr:carbohydrate ABC transporter permease [Chloroflexota bacterium]